MGGRIEAEQATEAADRAQHGRCCRRGRGPGDALDSPSRLLDIDARLAIRAHHAQRPSSPSLSSSSGTSVGYTPSKQALQRASVRPPIASSMASFDR